MEITFSETSNTKIHANSNVVEENWAKRDLVLAYYCTLLDTSSGVSEFTKLHFIIIFFDH